MKLLDFLLHPLFLGLLVSLAGAGAIYAQLEGGERGVAPIDSASTYEVTGVEVDVAGDSADEARYEGWRQAQARGWKALWASTNKRPQSEAPNLSDSALNGIVAGIIVEQEDIGPKRYIARLGVLFDRARTGELLGGAEGHIQRSAPMLVIPVMLTGASQQSFESRTEWQKAWARFRTGSSAIDYVRPVGNGIDPLLLNAAQTRRPGRVWWRMLLDTYGAADIVVPEVHIRRHFPGGPVIAEFAARHGPDSRLLARFALRAERSTLIPRLLDEGIRRIDAAYTRALVHGMLARDPSLTWEEPELPSEVEVIEEATAALALGPAEPSPSSAVATISIQVPTPNAASVDQAELSVSRISGVTSAITTSLALGGISVMRVTFSGDPAALAAALQAQGWTVQGAGTAMRISRPGPPAERE